jgi:hypothetical protein
VPGFNGHRSGWVAVQLATLSCVTTRIELADEDSAGSPRRVKTLATR